MIFIRDVNKYKYIIQQSTVRSRHTVTCSGSKQMQVYLFIFPESLPKRFSQNTKIIRWVTGFYFQMKIMGQNLFLRGDVYRVHSFILNMNARRQTKTKTIIRKNASQAEANENSRGGLSLPRILCAKRNRRFFEGCDIFRNNAQQSPDIQDLKS